MAPTVGVSLRAFFRHGRDGNASVSRSSPSSLKTLTFPCSVVATLWQATGGLDEFDTEDLCVRLHRYSLLQTLNLDTRHCACTT